jgi:hypothetical protein
VTVRVGDATCGAVFSGHMPWGSPAPGVCLALRGENWVDVGEARWTAGVVDPTAVADGDDALVAWERLRRSSDAPGDLHALVDVGLAESMSTDAPLDAMRYAWQADLVVHVAICGSRAVGFWTGRIRDANCLGGRALVRGTGLRAHWREDVPGCRSWLLRTPSSRGVAQSVVLLSGQGELRLCLTAAPLDGRPQPCAWRTAIETVRDLRGRPDC